MAILCDGELIKFVLLERLEDLSEGGNSGVTHRRDTTDDLAQPQLKGPNCNEHGLPNLFNAQN
jgi:hypothetical protein